MTKMFYSLIGVQVCVILTLLVYNLTGENPDPKEIKEIIALIFANWFISLVVFAVWWGSDNT